MQGPRAASLNCFRVRNNFVIGRFDIISRRAAVVCDLLAFRDSGKAPSEQS